MQKKYFCRSTFLAGLLALSILGCAGKSSTPKKIILQHPETMEFMKCNVGQWGSESAFATNEECVEEYKKQGYVIWGEH